jgi:hypothetical protein
MGFWLNRHRALVFLIVHDLFGKPLYTFPDHAPTFAPAVACLLTEASNSERVRRRNR